MKKLPIIILSLIFPYTTLPAQEQWNICKAVNNDGSDEFTSIYMDDKGLIWLGTNAGVKNYDGYTMKLLPYSEGTSTGVRCITQDSVGNIWIGTNNGLSRFDYSDGSIKDYVLPKKSQCIVYSLFTSSKGNVYAGTDDGFSIYDSTSDSFINYNTQNVRAIYPDGHTDRFWGFSVKSFVELSSGDILMGTWNNGLLRYSPSSKKFHSYSSLNTSNSAYTLYIDKQDAIWIGSWTYGLQKIASADDYTLSSLKTVYPTIEPIHSLCESADGNTIFFATDNGVYCGNDSTSAFNPLPYDLHSARRLIRGRDGKIWVIAQIGKLSCIDKKPLLFHFHDMKGRIYSLYSKDNKTVMTGGYESSNPIYSIIHRQNGDIVEACGDEGLRITHSDGGIDHISIYDTPWLMDNVTALCESHDGTLWIGQRMGISRLDAKGKGEYLEFKNSEIDMSGYFMINYLMEDSNGLIWACTYNNGIVSISPSSLETRHYLDKENIISCHSSANHLFALSAIEGLMEYDTSSDSFIAVNDKYHIPSKSLVSMTEDNHQNLWMAYKNKLLCLNIISPDSSTIHSFTDEDGLPGSTFMSRAVYRHDNRLYFGTSDGYISFSSDSVLQSRNTSLYNLIITDILFDGVSINQTDSFLRDEISLNIPISCKSINVQPSVKKLSIDFSLLSYTHTDQTIYSYKLEGYNDEWQYVEPGFHRATLEKLSSGKYTFKLRASDSNGNMVSLPYKLIIKVLPPWYATWWAYLIYLSIATALVVFIWNYSRMQREIKASRRFSAILQSSQIEQDSSATTNNVDEEEPIRHTLSQQRNAEFVSKVTNLVRNHISDPEYNRDSMAADMNMSLSSLYSKLRELTGLSIQTFIQTIRLNKACDILNEDPEIRINELAYQVGFNTPKYFSQCFKKEFGMLPGEYVKNHIN